MTKKKRNLLGAILAESRIIAEEDIQRALAEQQRSGVRFGEALVRLGIVSNEDVEWGLAHQLGLPLVRLSPENVDPAAVRRVPQILARRHHFVPYLLLEDELTIVIDDPLDRTRQSQIERELGLTLNVCLGLTDEIRQTLDALYGKEYSVWPANRDDVRGRLFDEETTDRVLEDPSAGVLLTAILERAAERRADAVFVEPQDDHTRVRLREAGVSRDMLRLARGWGMALFSQIRGTLRHVRESPGSVRGFLTPAGAEEADRYRVSIIETTTGPSITIAHTAPPALGASLDDLTTDPEDRKALRRIAAPLPGLVVVTGADEVRTARLAALLLRHRDAAKKKAVSIGTEGWFASAAFSHIPVGGSNEPDLAAAVQSARGHLAELLAIEGAMDRGFARAALEAAAAGIQVVGTMNFAGALDCLAFLAETAESPALVEAGLSAVVALRCVSRLDPERREARALSPALAKKLEIPHVAGAEVFEPARGEDDGGAAGEWCVLEIIPMSEAVSTALRESHAAAALRVALSAQGMRTMREKAIDLLLAGMLSATEFSSAFRR